MQDYQDLAWQKRMNLRIDYNNMMADFMGEHGLDKKDFDDYSDRMAQAAKNMLKKRDQMKWRELPHNQSEIVEELINAASYVRENFDTFVVLGIGGSALGPIAVQQALSHLRYNDLPSEKRNGPKLYVEDNIDPERVTS